MVEREGKEDRDREIKMSRGRRCFRGEEENERRKKKGKA